MMLASRPTTRPVASIITHFFSISAGLAEKLFMIGFQGSALCWRALTPRLASWSMQGVIRSGIKSLHRWFDNTCKARRYRMAGYGASPLIHPKLRARQRIRGSRVCDRRGVAVRAKLDFAGGESLAELEQPRLGGEIAARWLAQKIDVEIDSDRERHRADRAEQCHVHPEVGERHHGWAGNGAARPDEIVAEALAHAAAAVPYRFDHEAARGMKDLGKLGGEKAFEPLDRHQHRHAPPSPAVPA